MQVIRIHLAYSISSIKIENIRLYFFYNIILTKLKVVIPHSLLFPPKNTYYFSLVVVSYH